MEWLLALRRLVVRIGFTFMRRVGQSFKIKTGMFSHNTITIGNINMAAPSNDGKAELPDGTAVAHHYFLAKKAVIGTKAGPLPVLLHSTVHAEQVQQIYNVLERMHEHDFLAPLEETSHALETHARS